MTGACALLAFQRGEHTDEALVGAMMHAEFQELVVAFIKAWMKK